MRHFRSSLWSVLVAWDEYGPQVSREAFLWRWLLQGFCRNRWGCGEQPPCSSSPVRQFALNPLLNVLWCVNTPTIKPLKSTSDLITLEVTFQTCQWSSPEDSPGEPHFKGAVPQHPHKRVLQLNWEQRGLNVFSTSLNWCLWEQLWCQVLQKKKKSRDAGDEIWITNFSWCSGFNFAESLSVRCFSPAWAWFSHVAGSGESCVSTAAVLFFESCGFRGVEE